MFNCVLRSKPYWWLMTYCSFQVFFFSCAFLCCCRIPVLLNHLRETFVTHSWQCLRDNVCKSSCHFSSQIHGKLWKPVWKGKVFSYHFCTHKHQMHKLIAMACTMSEGKGFYHMLYGLLHWVTYFVFYLSKWNLCVVKG